MSEQSQERAKLTNTLQLIDGETRMTQQKYEELRESVGGLKRSASSAFDSALHVKTFLLERAHQNLINLGLAAGKPYFCRVDFREAGHEELATHYIGKYGVEDTQRHTMAVVDWRSPIANLYYSGQLGNVSYRCPDGNVEGELVLKRQFTIENGELKHMFDTDMVAQEAFLQDALSELKDNRLRDIVTTIQQEQNLVIRAPMNGPLLVQGAAGSGKTTIALHRIAYLLYAHQDTLSPKNLMILAPNPLFLDYISEVLPELGVEDVVQTTYVKLCRELMGKHGPKVAPADPLTLMLEQRLAKNAAERMVRCGRYKGSLAFRKKAEDYLRHLQSAMVPEASLILGKLRIYSHKELLRIFTEDFAPYPLVPRIKEMEKHLSFKMADSAARLVAYYEKDCQTRVNALKLKLPPGEERQRRIFEVYEVRDLRIKEVRTQAEERLKAYIAAFKVPTLLEAYQDFLAHYSADDPDLLTQLAAENREELLAGRIRREDLAALVLICRGLFGLSRKLSIQHVVMDEAQDFSPFELSLLGTLTGSDSVTLMGDLAQSIHPFQGIESWKEVAEQCYQRAGLETMTLVTSYRSTMEIMAVAESVLAHFTSPERPAAKPVLRHGPAPRFYKVGDEQRLPALQALAQEFAESYSSVAIITKTPAAGKALYGKLRKNIAVHLITQKDTHYEGGVTVLPAALAKGLEFDAAILADVSKENYHENPLDCHLLYVCLTRPLHALAGVFSGEPSSLLSAVSFMEWH